MVGGGDRSGAWPTGDTLGWTTAGRVRQPRLEEEKKKGDEEEIKEEEEEKTSKLIYSKLIIIKRDTKCYLRSLLSVFHKAYMGGVNLFFGLRL